MPQLGVDILDSVSLIGAPREIPFVGALAAKQFARHLNNIRLNHRMRTRKANKPGSALWDTSPWDDLLIHRSGNVVTIKPDTVEGHGIVEMEVDHG